jgi:hypothetical protein
MPKIKIRSFGMVNEMADAPTIPNETKTRVLFVIASEARQSSSTVGALDCRVASLLAMTGGVYG